MLECSVRPVLWMPACTELEITLSCMLQQGLLTQCPCGAHALHAAQASFHHSTSSSTQAYHESISLGLDSAGDGEREQLVKNTPTAVEAVHRSIVAQQ